jgi:hypothetical protein
MQRRDFLAASALGATAAVTSQTPLAQAQTADDARQYCEWRTFRLTTADKQPLIEKYLETAAIPAWGRMKLGPVGVFKEIGADATPSLHVLLVYPTLAAFATARDALDRDADYQKNAVDYFAAAKDDPAYERIDSWLMVAFEGFPKPAPPAKKPTVYELRTYNSYSEERARKKIEMFNKYELPIFPACGFENVFFGETLVGDDLPNLKYMLAAPDMAANEEGWKKFVANPDWGAVKDLPEYKDTVSNITKLFLTPTAYSQF